MSEATQPEILREGVKSGIDGLTKIAFAGLKKAIS
jgi:hypothetical protein